MSDNKPSRLPLVGMPQNRDLTQDRDSKLINGYIEQGAGGELWCYKRPGLTPALTPIGADVGTGYGITTWEGGVYSVFANGFCANALNYGSVGPVDYVSFSAYLGATPGMFFHSSLLAFTSTGGLPVAVVDPDYPSNKVSPEIVMPGAVFIDGTTYVMTSRALIYGSDINNPTSWDPLNVILAQIDPDLGVGIAKQQNYLIALKEFSVEVFYDAGNAAGSPLARVEAAKLSVGCADGETIRSIDGQLFWMSRSKQGGYGVMTMEGLKARSISTPAVDRLLQLATSTQCWGYTFRAFGHSFYGLRVSSTLSLIYDIGQQLWYQWADSAGNAFDVYDATSKPTSYLQARVGGTIWGLSNMLYQDTSKSGAISQFTFDLYTPNFDGGTRIKKTCNLMEIAADQTPGAVLQCRYSDDDYQTWSNRRDFDLGLERPLLPEWGSFRRRAHHFRQVGNYPLRLQAVDLHIDLGTL